jgi:hypothetical protein
MNLTPIPDIYVSDIEILPMLELSTIDPIYVPELTVIPQKKGIKRKGDDLDTEALMAGTPPRKMVKAKRPRIKLG